MKKYFPILLSKKGELVAIQYLEQTVKDEVSPVIQVLKKSLEKKDSKKNGGQIIYDDYLEKFLKTHWSFFANQVILDFSLFENIESQLGVIRGLITRLIETGVNIIPAVQKNSPVLYKQMVKDLIVTHSCSICIRTSNQSGGFLNYGEQTNLILSYFDTTESNSVLLLDMGDVTIHNYNLSASIAGIAIQNLGAEIENWKSVVVAASSFPDNLGGFATQDEPHRLTRYEFKMWQTITEVPSLNKVKCGDYGTRSASYSEVNYAGSVSLKYTGKSEFIIFRGEITDNHKDGHRQYIAHAQKLISLPEYSGNDFSWGDSKFYELADQDVNDHNSKTGNSTNWVQYSQNHHITLLHALL